jgi:nucleoporin NDC1
MTPLLHRRFARATTYLALLCYAESLYIGGLNSCRLQLSVVNIKLLTNKGLWSWFPLGRPGIRAALIFIPAFMIFILRVSQLHVGLRTSLSGWDTFKTFPKFQIVQTSTWYLFSAFLFNEVYIWSSTSGSDLGRVKYIPKTERNTLNEKPIYLTCYLLFLAILQAGFHLYYDYDKIDTGVKKDQEKVSSVQDSHETGHPADILYSRIPSLTFTALKRSLIMTLLGPFVYSFPFPLFSVRSFSWRLTRTFVRAFYSLPASGALPVVRPFHWTVLWTTFIAGFMLVLLWEVGNAAFSIYVGQAPLKNDRPITYESRDPNGSLLTGLQGKKVQTRVSGHACLSKECHVANGGRHMRSGSWYTLRRSMKEDGGRYMKTSIDLVDPHGHRFLRLDLERLKESTKG